MDALQSPSLSFGSKLGMVLAARFSQPNQRESLKLWYFPGSIPQPPGSPVALEMPALRSKCTCFQASNGWVNAMGLSSFSRKLSVSIPEPRATISIAMMPERLWRPDLAFTLGKRQKALSELTVTKDCAHNAWWLPLGFSTLTRLSYEDGKLSNSDVTGSFLITSEEGFSGFSFTVHLRSGNDKGDFHVPPDVPLAAHSLNWPMMVRDRKESHPKPYPPSRNPADEKCLVRPLGSLQEKCRHLTRVNILE